MVLLLQMLLDVLNISSGMYAQAKESFAQMQPPEVRIMKHLLSLDDPRQRSDELAAAFQPGPDLETKTHDFLSTCACSPCFCISFGMP